MGVGKPGGLQLPYVIESFLGLGENGHVGEEGLLDTTSGPGREVADRVSGWIGAQPPLSASVVKGLLARVRSRQEDVGYVGNYRQWVASVSPPDLC